MANAACLKSHSNISCNHGQTWWKYYRANQPEIRDNITENIVKVLSCKEQIRGFYEYECFNPACSYTKIIPFTCKSRFCLSCGKKATEQWVTTQNELLPKCEYQHITFTMPAKLWPFFHANRHLLTLLFKLAVDPLLKIADSKKVKIGVFTALHTFGRDLQWNVHVHVSVTRGGLSYNEKYWRDLYFTKHKVMPMWRYSIIDLLRQEYKKGKLTIPYEYQINNLYQLNRLLNAEYSKIGPLRGRLG